MQPVYISVSKCKITPFLAIIIASRVIKVSTNTKIGLTKDVDKIILHSCLMFCVKTKLMVHGFKLIA